MSEEKDSFVGKMDSQIHIILEKRINELEKKVNKSLNVKVQYLDFAVGLRENKERIEKLENQYKEFVEVDHGHVAFDQIDQLEQNDATLHILYEQQKKELSELKEQHIEDKHSESMRILNITQNIEEVLRDICNALMEMGYDAREIKDKLGSARQTECDHDWSPFGVASVVCNNCGKTKGDYIKFMKEERPPDATGILVEKAELEWLFKEVEYYHEQLRRKGVLNDIHIDKYFELKEKYLSEKAESGSGGEF